MKVQPLADKVVVKRLEADEELRMCVKEVGEPEIALLIVLL